MSRRHSLTPPRSVAGGFTIIELLTAMAIAAILAGLALPGLQDFIRNNRLTSASNSITLDLIYARSEAVKRNATVAICKSANGTVCGGSIVSWKNGWIVFINLNPGTTPAVVDAGETILASREALPGAITITPVPNYTNFIAYQADGSVNNWGNFELKDERGDSSRRCIDIAITGRPRVSKAAC